MRRQKPFTIKREVLARGIFAQRLTIKGEGNEDGKEHDEGKKRYHLSLRAQSFTILIR